MIYADTDSFIALLKPRDRLEDKAKRAFENIKGRLHPFHKFFKEKAY